MSSPKQSYFFSHDSNARNDIKVIKLRRTLGLEGYGIYWCLIEMLRDQADHQLPLDSIEDIAYQINTSHEKITAVIKNFGLFKLTTEHFQSERLIRSMALYKELSEYGKQGAAKRWNKPQQSGSAPLKTLPPA